MSSTNFSTASAFRRSAVGDVGIVSERQVMKQPPNPTPPNPTLPSPLPNTRPQPRLKMTGNVRFLRTPRSRSKRRGKIRKKLKRRNRLTFYSSSRY